MERVVLDRDIVVGEIKHRAHRRIQTQPRHYGLRRDYGLLLEERGKAAQAIEQLEAILPREGLVDDEGVVLALARAHLKLGNRDEAVNYLQRTLRANPNNAQALAMLQAIENR